MSTKYRLVWPEKSCPTCKHSTSPEPLMIGHSAAGWVFAWSLHCEETSGVRIQSLDQWLTYLAAAIEDGADIVDSYDKTVTLSTFLISVLGKRLIRPDGTPPRRCSRGRAPNMATNIYGYADDFYQEGSRSGS
jgi:hypothetical protein